MGKHKRLRNTGALKVVQGEYTLADSIEVLRENVLVGDTPLKDLTEAQLEVLYTHKIGNEHFLEAVRLEVVHRIEKMFSIGIEKAKNSLSERPASSSVKKAIKPFKKAQDMYNEAVDVKILEASKNPATILKDMQVLDTDEKSFKAAEDFLNQEVKGGE